MSKHTPGPWKVSQADSNYLAISSASGYVATLARAGVIFHAPENKDEAEANARLIAAAPEMMGALKRLINSTEQCGCDDEEDCPHYKGLRFTAGADAAIPEILAIIHKAAIAKAEGRE